MVERSSWLEEVVPLVARAAEVVGGSDRDHARLGPAQAEPDGWFRIQRRVAPSDLDRMDEAFLAPDGDPDVARFAVTAAEVRDASLFVRATTGSRVDDLALFAPSFSHRRGLEALCAGLARLPSGTLAERLGRRQLDPVPAPAPEPSRDRYTDDQHRAIEACCAPGLQVVWGPPGTGKTHVIAAAIRRLVADGRRVLLVSNTNIAVDNALQRVVSALDDTGGLPPGRLVRVGVPQIPGMEDDVRLSLRAMVRHQLATRQGAIEQLAARAAALAAEERTVAEDIATIERTLQRFDDRRLAEAAARQANQQALRDAEAAVQATQAALRDAEAGSAAAATDVLQARFACQILDERRAVERMNRAQSEREALADLTGIRAVLSKRALRRAVQEHRRAAEAADAATGARQRTQDALGSAAVRPAVPPPSSPEFADADTQARAALAAAESAAGDAAHRLDEARTAVATAQATAARWSATAQPSADDLRLLAEAERADLPGQRTRLAELTERSRRLGDERKRVDAERQELEAQDKKESRDYERQVITGARVVATTLTMLTLKPALVAEGYDHVIVDEAAAAPLPHVAHAVGLARTGACLLGDYFQNGPVLDQKLRDREKQEPPLVALFKNDCFTHLELTEPRAAQSSPGCVVLAEQHRFGPNVADLVNRTTYGGRPDHGGRCPAQ